MSRVVKANSQRVARLTGLNSPKHGPTYDVFGPRVTGPVNNPLHAVILHGILGFKRNWRTPAHMLSKMVVNCSVVVPDHRGHGSFHDFKGDEHSVATCATDLDILLETCQDDVPTLKTPTNDILCPDLIIAHSFGGKVALKWLEQRILSHASLPKEVWILDSLPGYYIEPDVDAANSVTKIIELINNLPRVYAKEQIMRDTLLHKGISVSIMQWLTSGLRVVDGEITWGFDVDVVTDLFYDFCALDMWPFLHTFDRLIEQHPDTDIHTKIKFLRAGRNNHWTPGVLAAFTGLEEEGCKSVELHTMPDVGHWLHAEDPKGTLQTIFSHSVII